MPDPADPIPPVDPIPPRATDPIVSGGATSSTTGLPSNVAAALACIPLIGGIIFYILEKRDSFVRFYAMQSIIFGIAWILVSIACAIVAGLFSAIPVIGVVLNPLWNVVAWLIHLALFVVMVIAMFKAFSGVRWEM